MARYAVVENDVVKNVIVADEKFIKDQKIDAILADDKVCVGWKYVGEKFIAPIPELVEVQILLPMLADVEE